MQHHSLCPPGACRYCDDLRDARAVLRFALKRVLVAALLCAAAFAVVVLCSCGPVPAPRPPATPTWALDVQTEPGAAVVIQDGPNALRRAQADATGRVLLTGLVQSGFTLCASGEGWKEACAGVTLTRSQDVTIRLQRLPPPAPPVQALHTDRQIFRTADGQPWRWKGVSAFKLLDRFSRGENIQPFLDTYRGYNVLRVWAYVEGAAWKGRDWPTAPSAEQTLAFLRYVGGKGWYVELTLLTDDAPSRLTWAKGFVPQLTAGGCPANLLIEAGNEPRTHKAIDTAALRSVLAASGCPHASGDYEQSARVYGTYGVAHTDRTADWPRRAHDLLEYFNGGGPHAPTDPAHKVPWVADEPGKPADVGTNEADWRAYFGAVALLGGGGTFHAETNKYGDLPTDTERRLAAVALDALNAFPADAPLGGYRRIVEAGQPRDARTYVLGGRYMVRCQQKGATAPEPGWTPLDALGVLWKR